MSVGRAPGGLPSRTRLRALILILASGACTQVLDIDGYTFTPSDGLGGSGGANVLDSNHAGSVGSAGANTSGASGSEAVGNAGSGSTPGEEPDAGSGDPDASLGGGGASGAAGASGGGAAGIGNAGSSGIAGSSGFAGASGIGGAGGYSGSTGTAGSSGVSGAGGLGGVACDSSEVCVPDVPNGWQGPFALGANGVTVCPSEYSNTFTGVMSGLLAPAPTCGCGCFLNGVSCYLESGNTGDSFFPQSSCESPPTADDCLTARVDTSCTPQPSVTVPAASWQVTQIGCSGASARNSCSGGLCYPSVSSFGPLCILSAGNVQCPSGYTDRATFFQSFTDTRSCATCGCFPTGQECKIDIQVCDLGFTDYTLDSLDEIPACLNTSDGDGVTLLGTQTVSAGTCQTTGGGAQGSATGTSEVTVCCVR